MTIKKSEYISLLLRYFYYKKDFCSISAIYGFDLLSKETIEEKDLYKNLKDFFKSGYFLDGGYPKKYGEFLVYGYCYNYEGKTAKSKAFVKVADREKELVVYGDREWLSEDSFTSPKPFEKMFLAPKFKDGYLPNLEYENRPIKSKNDIYVTSYLPIPFDDKRRLKYIGKYDKEYLKEYWPGFGESFDFFYFNIAEDDQILDRFLKSEDEIVIKNMHPDIKEIKTSIPKKEIECIVNGKELRLDIDTLWLFPHKLLGVVISKAVVETVNSIFSDIKKVSIKFKEEDFISDKILNRVKKSEKKVESEETGVKNSVKFKKIDFDYESYKSKNVPDFIFWIDNENLLNEIMEYGLDKKVKTVLESSLSLEEYEEVVKDSHKNLKSLENFDEIIKRYGLDTQIVNYFRIGYFFSKKSYKNFDVEPGLIIPIFYDKELKLIYNYDKKSFIKEPENLSVGKKKFYSDDILNMLFVMYEGMDRVELTFDEQDADLKDDICDIKSCYKEGNLREKLKSLIKIEPKKDEGKKEEMDIDKVLEELLGKDRLSKIEKMAENLDEEDLRAKIKERFEQMKTTLKERGADFDEKEFDEILKNILE